MFEDTFSKRRGYIPPPVQGAKESLSEGARKPLWDIFYLDFCEPNKFRPTYSNDEIFTEQGERFLDGVWTEILDKRIDERRSYEFILGQIRLMFERGKWFLLFDIWEEIFKWGTSLVAQPQYSANAIRKALEVENTAYTFVGHRFVERMTSDEVQSIEKALRTPIEGIREHFATALRMLRDRENPDHRNSTRCGPRTTHSQTYRKIERLLTIEKCSRGLVELDGASARAVRLPHQPHQCSRTYREVVHFLES